MATTRYRNRKVESRQYEGSLGSIRDAIDAIGAARLSWCLNGPIYADLGIAKNRLLLALKRAQQVGASNRLYEIQQANSPQAKAIDEELATTCFHCGDPAIPETHGFDPRCERHRDV